MRERLRTLRLDGRTFTWRAEIRAAPTGNGRRRRSIRVRVWGSGKNGCVLQADLVQVPPPPSPALVTTPAAAFAVKAATTAENSVPTGAEPEREATQPADVVEATTYVYPSAAIVLKLIAWGLEAGWAPEKVGGTFQIGAAGGPDLPGLVLVDLP